jgi:transcriptional regulator GlxA family with amidase domain
MAREIVFFVHPGFVLLDLSGPLEAFNTAETMAPGSYRPRIVSLAGGPVRSSCGVPVITDKAGPGPVDTLLVVGDFTLPEQTVAPETITYLRTTAAEARRTASVCMGAFLLAASGLLDGCQATTHWLFAARLQALYPRVRVDGDRVYARQGTVWTSAGMTAGIDMTLALIEEDLGADVAKAVARMLVVYYRRPGGQYQYSSLLDLAPENDRVRDALAFAREHLAEPLPVEALADAARLSVRQFSRMFLASTGTTPAKAVERLRVEAARPRVEEGRETLDGIAQATGFADPDRMRQSFIRILGVTPQALRRTSRNA